MAGRARDTTATGEGGEMTTEGRRSGGGSASAGAAAKVAPFLGMLRYADRADAGLMEVGAAANGMSEPLMSVVFAAVIECFGAGDDATVLHRVSKVHARACYLLVGCRASVVCAAARPGFTARVQWLRLPCRSRRKVKLLYMPSIFKLQRSVWTCGSIYAW